MNRNVPIQPTRTAVASASGANALVANIDAVAGRETIIHGIDVTYSAVSSYEVTIEDAGVPIWARVFNQEAHIDFGSSPLQTTEATSIQAVCTTPAATIEGRATLRYTQ